MVMQGDGFQSDLMTEDEAANYLTVSKSSIRRWVQEGLISKFRVGKKSVRYRRSDLDAYIESQQRTAVEGE